MESCKRLLTAISALKTIVRDRKKQQVQRHRRRPSISRKGLRRHHVQRQDSKRHERYVGLPNCKWSKIIASIQGANDDSVVSEAYTKQKYSSIWTQTEARTAIDEILKCHGLDTSLPLSKQTCLWHFLQCYRTWNRDEQMSLNYTYSLASVPANVVTSASPVFPCCTRGSGARLHVNFGRQCTSGIV